MMTEHLISPLFQMNGTYPQSIQAKPHNYSPFRSLLQMTGHILAPFMQEGVRLCLLEPDEKNGVIIITCLYASPEMKRLDGKTSIADCSFFEECKTGKAICIEDSSANQGNTYFGLTGSYDVLSELLCPVIAGERILGILSIQRNIVYHWTKEDILDIQKIAISLYRHILTYEHLAFRSRLLDAASDAIIVLDGCGCIHFWNTAAEGMFGYSAHEATGLHLDAVLNIDQSSSAEVKKSLAGSGFYTGEIPCGHRHGQTLYIEVLGKVYRNENGEILEVIFSLRDNTERRNMELMLEQQANDLEQQTRLLELFGEAIIIWQLDGGITYWNKGAEQMYGYQQKEAIGQISYELLQTKLPNTEEHILTVLAREGFISGEIEQTRKDGKRFLTTTNQKVITNEYGEKFVFEITRVIAQRNQDELLICHQKAILKKINKIHVCSSVQTTMEELSRILHEVIEETTGSPLSFVAEVNKDGSFQSIINGVSRSASPNMVGSWAYRQYTQSTYLNELYKSVVQQNKSLLVNTPKSVFDGVQIPEGHPAIRRFICVPFVFNGETTGIITVANKKSEYTEDDRNLLEELAPTIIHALQKKKAQIALDLINGLGTANQSHEFLNALSHELRNPLATIVASLHFLDVAQDTVQVEKAKAIIKRQTEQLCRLTDDLLDHTRIQKNKIQLRKTRVELKSLLLSIIEDYSLLFRQKGLRFITDIQPKSLYLYADPVRLEQLVGNILDNALKYTQSGGTVSLALTKSSTEALIQVKDNGQGIKSEALPRLFDPFVQEDRHPEMRNNGLGLGLSIAMGIAKLHGGSIGVFSEGAGKGSVFSIHLPLPSQPGGIHAGVQPFNSAERSLRILFIDDNMDFARMLCAMMQFEGHKTESAKDGTDGLNKARAFLPDVIFCDIELPGSNCFEFARHIRSDMLFQDVYLIAIADPQSKALIADQPEFDTLIYKPIDMAAVKKLLENIPGKV